MNFFLTRCPDVDNQRRRPINCLQAGGPKRAEPGINISSGIEAGDAIAKAIEASNVRAIQKVFEFDTHQLGTASAYSAPGWRGPRSAVRILTMIASARPLNEHLLF